MSVKKRILEFIKYKDITTKEFENSIGAGNSYVNNIRISIGDDKLEQISKAYPELNTIWLKMGIGKMLKNDNSNISVEERESSYIPGKAIPLIPTSAILDGDAGEFVIAENKIEQRYFIPDFVGADYMIRVNGSSMYPKYSAGDLLACMKIEKDNFIQWNKTYVLETSQGTMVRRIVKGGKSSKDWILRSDNKDYADISISPQKDVYSISLVIGVVRFE